MPEGSPVVVGGPNFFGAACENLVTTSSGKDCRFSSLARFRQELRISEILHVRESHSQEGGLAPAFGPQSKMGRRSHTSCLANGQIKPARCASFCTGNLVDRILIFRRDDCCESFIQVLRALLSGWPSKIISYVLMTEHFHLIVNPRDGDIKGFIGALKSCSSRKIVEVTNDPRFLRLKPDTDGSIHQVWQESFKALPMWSSWMIWQKINYIHANPVRAGLVNSAKDYRWSSFGAFYHGLNGPLPVDQDWWWPDDGEKLSAEMKRLGWRTYHKRSSEES